MSDVVSGLPGLVEYYDFVERHLPLSNGKPRSKRSAQEIAQRYNLPLVRIGLLSFIDPALAVERLREAQLRDRTPRSPGRPRNAA